MSEQLTKIKKDVEDLSPHRQVMSLLELKMFGQLETLLSQLATITEERDKLMLVCDNETGAIKKLTDERNHWHNNHADMVKINAELRDRPDLGDRCKSIDNLTADLDTSEAACADLMTLNDKYRKSLGVVRFYANDSEGLHPFSRTNITAIIDDALKATK